MTYIVGKKFFEKLMRYCFWKISPKLRAILPYSKASDRLYSILLFVERLQRFPKKDSGLFNDRLHFLKTSNEIIDPIRVFVSDKQYLKMYVQAMVGARYVVPTIAVLDNEDDIANFNFPAKCCIKPTHASGEVILRLAGEPLDYGRVTGWLKINFYYGLARERNYKYLRPKVIVEEIVFNAGFSNDFKIFCYQGKPKIISVDTDRFTGHKRKLFDSNWNDLSYSLGYPLDKNFIPKPKNLVEMLEVAKILSSNFNFVRVDFYTNGDSCIVGEITNCHGAGLESFNSLEDELAFSRLIFS